MEFAKYYDVSKIVDDMQTKEEIYGYPTGEDKFIGIYVCMDTNDFWICRILKGYNEEYEQDENMYLVERNKFSIYDVMDKLYDQFGKRLLSLKKMNCHVYRKIKYTIILENLKPKILSKQSLF